jgi:lipid-binding SYLF domain-containing protein
MRPLHQFLIAVFVVMMAAVSVLTPKQSFAASASEINRGVNVALAELYAKVPKAKKLGKRAKGILVFPRIIKAGLIIGGQIGNGALRKKGKTVGYYRTVAASYGLQAGIQKFSYAVFFMTEPALNYLNKSEGWEIGGAPSLVVADKGISRSLSTTTLQNAIYVFFFGQKGLMAGLGVQGTKITRIWPDK